MLVMFFLTIHKNGFRDFSTYYISICFQGACVITRKAKIKRKNLPTTFWAFSRHQFQGDRARLKNNFIKIALMSVAKGNNKYIFKKNEK